MMDIQLWLPSFIPVANMTPKILEARIFPINLDVINKPEAIPLSDLEINEYRIVCNPMFNIPLLKPRIDNTINIHEMGEFWLIVINEITPARPMIPPESNGFRYPDFSIQRVATGVITMANIEIESITMPVNFEERLSNICK